MKRMNIDDKLGLNHFKVDNSYVHIEVDPDFKDEKEIERVVMACPAKLYRYEDGVVTFSYEGCLECGTCRVVSGGKLIKSWNHPMGAMGVDFRQG